MNIINKREKSLKENLLKKKPLKENLLKKFKSLQSRYSFNYSYQYLKSQNENDNNEPCLFNHTFSLTQVDVNEEGSLFDFM